MSSRSRLPEFVTAVNMTLTMLTKNVIGALGVNLGLSICTLSIKLENILLGVNCKEHTLIRGKSNLLDSQLNLSVVAYNYQSA